MSEPPNPILPTLCRFCGKTIQFGFFCENQGTLSDCARAFAHMAANTTSLVTQAYVDALQTALNTPHRGGQ